METLKGRGVIVIVYESKGFLKQFKGNFKWYISWFWSSNIHTMNILLVKMFFWTMYTNICIFYGGLLRNKRKMFNSWCERPFV